MKIGCDEAERVQRSAEAGLRSPVASAPLPVFPRENEINGLENSFTCWVE
jgi:hypothetical protein